MASPVLWQNESQTTILIDIPRSIEAAQGTAEAPCHDHLLSVTPLETPFPSNEPKSEAARAKLVGNSTDQQLDREYVELLSKALAETHEAYHGRWCLPRPFVRGKPRVAKKRKLHTDEPSNPVQSTPTQKELPEDFLRTLADDTYFPNSPDNENPLHPTQANNPTQTTQYLTNRHPHQTTLNLSTPTHPQQPYTFLLPPSSTFSLTNCTHSIPFRNFLRAQASLEDTPRRTFDVILLDPPWPNRSIKRTHRTPGTSYHTASNLSNLTDLLHSMDLEMLMSPSSCIVGVWITNKPSIREAVLDLEEGLFAMWGVELVEEWVWVKTTAPGEPVSRLEGTWRKPYEVLLVGRRGGGLGGGTGCAESYSEEGEGMGGDGREMGGGGKKVKRRVILGVPDLHSRKPCLKGLVEEILLRNYHHHHYHHDDGRTGYRALEVFARNLVDGWWSWGDECVKFNWEGYWRSGDELEKVRGEK